MNSNDIIKNKKDLDVSSNEYSLSYTAQRVINRLFENDKLLNDFFKSIFGEYLIYEYESQCEYEYGQLVWFLNRKESITILKNGDFSFNLYILRCNRSKIAAGSLDRYADQLKDKSESFELLESIGWTDLNPNIDILTKFGLDKKITSYFNKIFKKHSNDENYHRFNKISYDPNSQDYMNQKVAKNTLLNLNSGRENNFFPYSTWSMMNTDETSPILNGIGRKYDNGLLEYDITFRLGYLGFFETDSEYKISSDMFKCNDLSFTNNKTMSKYFNSSNDMDIFKYQNDESNNYSSIGETIQTNRNDYVNVYSAEIDFSQGNTYHEFKDTNYMIFTGDLLSQNRQLDLESLNHSQNSMIFCDKQKNKFTAILITYPNQSNYNKSGYNSENGGLMANSFHCHVIGKTQQGFNS